MRGGGFDLTVAERIYRVGNDRAQSVGVDGLIGVTGVFVPYEYLNRAVLICSHDERVAPKVIFLWIG